ncbi:MAG: LamG-like jellyroll fold domain-containing protein [Verrucomicrobiales bacterium]
MKKPIPGKAGLALLLAVAVHAPFSKAEVVSQWSFEDGLADTAEAGGTADDLEATGDAEFADGIVGRAVKLTAAGLQRLRAADSDDLDLAANWTLEAFVWPDEDNTGEWDRLWTKWGDGGNEWHTSFRSTGAVDVENGLDLFINGGTNVINSNNTAEVPLETWSHVAFVGDEAAGTISAWLNGVKVGEAEYTAVAPGDGAMNFGNFDSPANDLQYSGLIDEAMIHNVAVTSDYLQGRAALLNGGGAENAVAKWSFEDNLDDTAPTGTATDTLEPFGDPEYAPGVPGLGGKAINITAGGLQRLRAEDSDDLDLAESWTLEAFVWPDADNSGEWDRFWTKWGDGGNEWHTSFRSTGAVDVANGLDLFLNGGNNVINSNDTAEVPLETWSHVAFVGDAEADTITAWLNGVKVGETVYEEVIPGDGAMNFGNFESPANGLQYSGLIDEAMIHSIAVDEAYLKARSALIQPNDPDGDPDGDGLTNAQEVVLGTDPNNPDTDGDTLSDGVETNTGTWAGIGDTGTDPRKKDTDGDGLDDNVENPELPFVDASQPGTDPNKADTDGDQNGDRNEIANGLNPTVADPVLPNIVSRWSFDGNLEDNGPDGANQDNLEATGDPEFAPGIIGQAVRISAFDEGLQRLRAEDSDDLDLAENWTLEAFVWPDADNAGEWDRFWAKWEGGSQWHLSFRSTGAIDVENGIDLFINGSNNIMNSNDTAEVPLEHWSHIAVVGSAATGKITAWLNGVQVGESEYEAVEPGTGAMNFGNFESPANGLQYSGLIDDAIIHGNAVSVAYIKSRAALLQPAPTQIADITVDRGANKATITWKSTPGKEYALEWTDDFVIWRELDDGIVGAEGETTSADDAAIPAESQERYYRVRE